MNIKTSSCKYSHVEFLYALSSMQASSLCFLGFYIIETIQEVFVVFVIVVVVLFNCVFYPNGLVC